MSEPEQCIICLEPLPRLAALNPSPQDEAPPSTAAVHDFLTRDGSEDDAVHLEIVAALDGCQHVNHDACIRSWAQKTNTCPICRMPFHTVRVYNGVDGTSISTYKVQDRKQVADFDAQQWMAQNLDPEDDEASHPCPICNSADNEDVLLLCDGCEAAYHTYCVGMDYVPHGDWFCMECVHVFDQTDASGATRSPQPQTARRPNPREVRGYNVRTRARLRTVRRQARRAEWQGAWGQFSVRIFEMSDLDLENHDDEDLEQYRLFQQHDQRELQRWQQRVNITNRLGAHEEFGNSIPQISERLQPPPPPVEDTREERRAWGAFDRAREADSRNSNGASRKRRNRSVTASPSEPVPEPERKLKRPRTRRLPNQGEASTAAASPATPGLSAVRPANGLSSRNGLGRVENVPPLVSSLLKELEPNTPSENETHVPAMKRWSVPEASSPAISPSPSNHSSLRALSLTPPPLPRTNGHETSPTLSLSTHIEPRYPPANYSPNRAANDHVDSEARPGRAEVGMAKVSSLELRQPRPRRWRPAQPRADISPTRSAMTHEEKKRINFIVKDALRPHWRAQKLTTAQYEAINRAISRKLYDEVKDASALDEETRQSWEKRANQEVAEAVAELRI